MPIHYTEFNHVFLPIFRSGDEGSYGFRLRFFVAFSFAYNFVRK